MVPTDTTVTHSTALMLAVGHRGGEPRLAGQYPISGSPHLLPGSCDDQQHDSEHHQHGTLSRHPRIHEQPDRHQYWDNLQLDA